jgi:hypothetical protein
VKASIKRQILLIVPLFTAIWGCLAQSAPHNAAGAASDREQQLKVDAQKLADAQLAKMGQAYTAKADTKRHIVYVSALDDKHLQKTANLLASYIDAQHKTLLTVQLPWNVVIVLPTADDYKKLAPGRNIPGFYDGAQHTLYSLDRGTLLIHEFTHALHHADMAASRQLHQIWVCEGLASLFESSTITEDGLEPQTDARLLSLLKAIRQKNCPTLQALLKLDQKDFTANADICYAQARYLMFYLYELDLLDVWYAQYKKDYVEDATGAASLETVLKKTLPQIQDDWLKWVAGLKVKTAQLVPARAKVGAVVTADDGNVKIARLIKGGAAQQSGRLAVGDVVVEFNGAKTPNIAQYVAAVNAAGALQTVSIKLIRAGQPMVVQQPMDPPTK